MFGILRFLLFSLVILSMFSLSAMTISETRHKHCDSKHWSKECIFRKLHKPLSVFETFRYFLSGSHRNKEKGRHLSSESSSEASSSRDKMTSLYKMTPVTQQPPTPSEREMRIIKNNLFRLENEPCGMSLTNKLQDEWWTAPREYPWLALLLYRSPKMPGSQTQNLCGGSLINDRYVLTSAYCLSMPKYDLHYVRLGEFNLEYFERNCSDLEMQIFDTISFEACSTIPPIDYDYAELILHPQYVYSEDVICGNHDIGLIRLAERVTFTEQIRPVCLPVGRMKSFWDPNNIGANFTIVGWGMMNVVPMRAVVSLKDKTTCSDALNMNLLDGQFCVESDDDLNRCQGDIGGALMRSIDLGSSDDGTTMQTKSIQVGVLSSIFCNYSTPLFFTSVETYLPWILETIEP